MDPGWKYMLPTLLLSASILDVLYSKIPNVLTFTFMAGGLAYHIHTGGIDGLALSLSGLILGIILLLIFYLTGGMGAGDVKLMGAVGSLLGPSGVFKAFLISALIGGLYAVLVIVICGKSRGYMDKIISSLKYIFLMRKVATLSPDEASAVPRMRYGVAIAIGTALSVYAT